MRVDGSHQTHRFTMICSPYCGYTQAGDTTLTLSRRLFPVPRFSAKADALQSTFAGCAFLPGKNDNNDSDTLTVLLGSYEGLALNPQ
ncbi:hypothetical protein [Pantoea sp. GD03673]|uniref:hypothetical protein n=1 Tax=Pantoea sp. GD03673 TaxID=2975364 RepID=UPI0024483273|nr:hypothetical protein [Pantoea sp. GD03673]MDH2067444.1 hypothetical protein [Pantoea sp. GD03673]